MADSTTLPAIWNIPYQRNPFFTGSEEVLALLHRSLQTDNSAALTQPQGISGLGGIGKTQTALEYAYRYHADYRAVFWVWAGTHNALISGFVAIADLLDLPEKDERDQNRIVEAVMRWFRINSGWLLIFDNADDLEVVRNFIPAAHRGHILLTTRAQAIGLLAQPVKVEKMHPEVGALFLLRRTSLLPLQAHLDIAPHDDRKLAIEISQVMDGLPLALDQAGAYIKEMSCGLPDYLDLYRTRSAHLLKARGNFAINYPESVATTWSLSFEKVARANPASAELLSFCAFLYPDSIPEEIITEGASNLGSLLQAIATNPVQLDAAFKELLRFSLLQREADARTFTIHRLVQEVLKDKMDEHVRGRWAKRTMLAVNDAFPTPEFEAWSRCKRCVLQAQTCTALITQWQLANPEAIRLLNNTGSYLKERARYGEAEQILQQALALCGQAYGVDHPDTAFTLNNLAGLYFRQERYAESESLMLRALTICEQTLGPVHPNTAASLGNLAGFYLAREEYATAESFLQRSLAIYEQVKGPDDPQTARTNTNLALAYLKQGKYAKAESLLQQALATRGQILGYIHPHVAHTLYDLGWLFAEQERYSEAALHLQQALTIWEQALESEHPEVASCLNDLAEIHKRQGQYSEAEPLLQRALTIREKSFGTNNSETMQSLANLAELYLLQAKYSQARPLLQRALVISEKMVGPEHPATAQIVIDLAKLYEALGQDEEAEPLYQRALTIFAQVLGPTHPNTVAVRKDYITLSRKMQQK